MRRASARPRVTDLAARPLTRQSHTCLPARHADRQTDGRSDQARKQQVLTGEPATDLLPWTSTRSNYSAAYLSRVPTVLNGLLGLGPQGQSIGVLFLDPGFTLSFSTCSIYSTVRCGL